MSEPSSSSLIPSDSFRLEDHLLDVIYAQLPEMLVGKSRHLLARYRKYPVGAIVPDLVLVISKRATVQSVKPKKLSMIDCSILFAISQSKGATLATIAGKIFVRESLIHASVERLVKSGVITTRGGHLTIRKEVTKQTAQVLSIEAKLTRWRDAITQAKAYLRFSNAAYVALPMAQIARLKDVKAACKLAGVGLISVNQETCRIIVRAPVSLASTGEWFWILNKTRGLGF